jgi:hypothetical protein
MTRYAKVVTLALTMAAAGPASAHCDTTQGPVVTAARAALEAGNVDLVLHWVRPEDEPAIRSVFAQSLQVWSLGERAKALSERYFFETVVRVHRMGEGAPYTGLTDADPEPMILATDRALLQGSSDELEQRLVAAVKAGLNERFERANVAKDFRAGDVSGGRAFVAAYVPLTHWVEGVFAAASGTDDHHGDAETSPSPGKDHGAETPHAAAQHDDLLAVAKTSRPHGATQVVPWILAGILAVATLIEGYLLVRRRRSATA